MEYTEENMEMYYHQLKHASYPLLLTSALVDIIPICKALVDIMDRECCTYDHDEAAVKADAWLKYFAEVEKDVKSNSDN